jgi:hypothetical protein
MHPPLTMRYSPNWFLEQQLSEARKTRWRQALSIGRRSANKGNADLDNGRESSSLSSLERTELST